MEAVIKIIEGNIPEVKRSACFWCWLKCSCFLVKLKVSVSCQLTSLNLSNNRIHKLDELAELVTKVPHLKTLNLSHNEVKMAAHMRIITRCELGPYLTYFDILLTTTCSVPVWLSSWSQTGSWTSWKAWSWWSCGWTGTLCVTSSRIRPRTSGQSASLGGEMRRLNGGDTAVWLFVCE